MAPRLFLLPFTNTNQSYAMAITRARKEAIVTEIKDLFQQSKLTVVADYQGLPVAQFQALRAELDKAGIAVKVVKNRLVIKALKNWD